MIRSGRADGVPYSLSRWTDVAAGKWSWFEACLKAGKLAAFEPRCAEPQIWSLAPEDTLGLTFWTKNPSNLILNKELLKPYNVVVQMTITGWYEAEAGVPDYEKAASLMFHASKEFKVYWRFSPIPVLPQDELLPRFSYLLTYASVGCGLDRVYVSFLQKNDRMPETRSPQEKYDVLNSLAELAADRGVKVVLCDDDRSVWKPGAAFEPGVCAPASDFDGPTVEEECGCVLMADPFTINEACPYNCAYCYTADNNISPERRNTTC